MIMKYFVVAGGDKMICEDIEFDNGFAKLKHVLELYSVYLSEVINEHPIYSYPDEFTYCYKLCQDINGWFRYNTNINKHFNVNYGKLKEEIIFRNTFIKAEHYDKVIHGTLYFKTIEDAKQELIEEIDRCNNDTIKKFPEIANKLIYEYRVDEFKNIRNWFEMRKIKKQYDKLSLQEYNNWKKEYLNSNERFLNISGDPCRIAINEWFKTRNIPITV